MIPLIALSRSQSRDGVLPGGRTETEGATTTGGRDKRRGTDARYVVVVVGHFARCGHGHSAAPRFNPLFSCGFHRAACFLAGIFS
ncbi:hypothetical protein HY2_11905 [Hyphomonas pacifica]|nr:hypothetical protein HY2_11905 [Hyphomonas pacifica]